MSVRFRSKASGMWWSAASDAGEIDAVLVNGKTFVPGIPTDNPKRDNRHRYVPNRKYPWFCGICGYAEHEELMHLPKGT